MVHYSLGRRLKLVRELSGYSQRELAKLMGISNASVSRWENELRAPNAKEIFDICAALNISSDWLIGLKDDNEITKEVVKEWVTRE